MACGKCLMPRNKEAGARQLPFLRKKGDALTLTLSRREEGIWGTPF